MSSSPLKNSGPSRVLVSTQACHWRADALAASSATRAFLVGVMLFAAAGAGCASVGGSSGYFQHPELGFRVSGPRQADPSREAAWQELRVKDADLAFSGPNDAFMALSSRCGESQTDPAVLGRQLLVGLQRRTRLASEGFEFAGGRAFSQVVEALEDDVLVRTKTVTLVLSGCVIDWVLVAPGFLPDVEATFDLWWRGFEASAMPERAAELLEGAP